MIPMKRTIFIVIFCLFATTFAQAQTRDVRRATTQLNRGNIANAKEMIDVAMQDQTALNDATTHVTRAKVYIEIFVSQDPEVKALHNNPLEVAYEALKTAQVKDTNNANLIEIQQTLLVMSELTFNSAVEAFNKSDYSNASRAFRRSYALAEEFGSIDTTTLYNAALAAEMAREFAPAEEMYMQLVAMDYDQPYMFSSLTNILMSKGDTVAATNMIKSGRTRYPEDLNLIFSEANIYIFTGQVDEASEILNLAIEKDPENPNLYFAFAANYDRMAQDTIYSLEDRQFAFREAEKSYMKAIELDPDYFDAIYNLGVLYFNEGIRIFEEADLKLRANPTSAAFRQYEVEEKRFQEKWLQAQPYLETAMEMLGDDETNLEVVVVSLMQLYARTNQPGKLEVMQNIYHEKFAPEE